jgi:hypothetical protein
MFLPTLNSEEPNYIEDPIAGYVTFIATYQIRNINWQSPYYVCIHKLKCYVSGITAAVKAMSFARQSLDAILTGTGSVRVMRALLAHGGALSVSRLAADTRPRMTARDGLHRATDRT